MKKRFLMLFILFFCALSQAQECPPTCKDGEYCNDSTDGKCLPIEGLPPPPGDNLPIDSNISLLFIAGILIGATYIFRSDSKKVQ